MYRCEVDLCWKQHDKNFEIAKKRRVFINNTKEEVYGYIKYYTLAWGICDVIMIEEGEIDDQPIAIQDHEDTGSDTFVKSVETTQNAIKSDIDIS